MDAETLSSKERHTIRVLADTLVPSLAVSPDSDGFYGRKASDLAVDEDVARIIERYLSPEQRADFRRLLRTVESPMANLLLSGTPRRFSTESEANRERFLLGWAHSRLGIKRQGFHAVKRLVIVLEAGSYRTAATFRQREAEAYDTMFQGHGVLTTTDLAFSVLAGQTAGGSSTINWMTCLKPPRWAREEWEQEAGMTGVASPAFDSFIDEVWSRLHVNVEESVVNPSNDVLRRGSEALGYRFGIDYDVIPRNAHGCGSRCDFCFFGCVYDAKQSSLVTYLPDANRAGARFLFDTKADHLIIQIGEVRGVEATIRDGAHSSPVRVRARTVVAAGSAIQTPALLLRSGIRSSGVGLGLRLDPTTALFGEFAAPIRMWSGPMQTIVVHRFQGSEEGHHGPWLESAPGHPGLSALAIPWSGGRAHKDAMRRLDRAASTIVLVRDVAEGRVTIDARGEPLLQYHLSSRDRRNLTHGLQEAARILRAAGALRMGSLHLRECWVGDGREPIRGAEFDAFIDRMGRLGIRENGVALFSAHPMGSARAGTDPRTSAAKPTGESHDVRNLWIGDGSLLPTAPGVNPMISIMALAARTAGFIRERLSRGG